MVPVRYLPLAIVACTAVTVGDAAAQAMTPLRVDPTLLGLPPVEKPPSKPTPAKPVEPAEPERVRAEVKPVEAPVVEQKTVGGENAPTDGATTASTATTVDKAPRSAERQASSSSSSSRSAVSAGTGRPAAPAKSGASVATASPPGGEPVPAATPVAPPTQPASRPPVPPAAVVTTAAEKVTTLGPLRVHPGLLGQPVPEGAAALASASPATTGGVAGKATAVGMTPSAALASLETARQDAWRGGSAPVLAFSSEPEVLPADKGAAPALKQARGLTPLKSEKDLPRPMFLSADELTGITDREAVAQGNAEARKQNTVVTADRLTYWPLDDELEAKGNVKLVQNDDVMTGPRMRMKLEAQTGVFEAPNYFLKREPKWAKQEQNRLNAATWSLAASSARGSDERTLSSVLGMTPAPLPPLQLTEAHGKAERIDFEGENRMRVVNGDYTTCKPGSADWYVRAEQLDLDYDRGVGEGKNGTVYFKDVPILYSPWLSFALNNERKSGFLAPTMGMTSASGLLLAAPYYWNIAPNMDAIVAPRVFSKRGLLLASEFRYIDHYDTQSQLRAEVMPNDSARERSRYGYSLMHKQQFGYGFAGALNVNGVSDSNYFTDLSARSALTSQTQLLRQGIFAYGTDWLNANVTAQGYQTLRPDPNVVVIKPYSLAPQVNVNARLPDVQGLDLAMLGQYTSFAHDSLDQGRRFVAYPQISLPYMQPGYYVTPKIGVHMTNYSLDRRTSTGADSVSRTLPIFSVDAGMTFERETSWFGARALQTLEPRLYYLNVPYRDQSQIPIFDSGLADFNYAQIFSENQYVGYDRVSDANQLTAALVSRLIDPSTGAEAMRAMIGQRFYFSRQKTTLPSQVLSSWNRSDFLAAFSGRVWPKGWLDLAAQYNSENTRFERFSAGARYQPELGKVLNVSYRYNRDSANLPIYNAAGTVDPNSLKSIDISGQWPVWSGWSAVGRYNYSLKDRQPVETVGGLEYNAGCWAVRFVGHQLATISGKTNTSFFVQLELSDFARIGSNPLDLLRRNIQGFGLNNQSVADPVFGM